MGRKANRPGKILEGVKTLVHGITAYNQVVKDENFYQSGGLRQGIGQKIPASPVTWVIRKHDGKKLAGQLPPFPIIPLPDEDGT